MLDVRESTEIEKRGELATLCNEAGLLSEAVEIGVDCAAFAVRFLEAWRGNLMYLIDPWGPYPEKPYDREPDYDIAIAALARFNWRVRVFRAVTAEAFLRFEGPIDFAYIDGDHSEIHVEQDISLAWGRLRPGGLIAGHDYRPDFPGVLAAVNRFAVREGLTVWLTREPLPSWYCWRPKRETPQAGEGQASDSEEEATPA